MMKSAPGPDGRAYLPPFISSSLHHFMATLFKKILKAETAPGRWGQAHI